MHCEMRVLNLCLWPLEHEFSVLLCAYKMPATPQCGNCPHILTIFHLVLHHLNIYYMLAGTLYLNCANIWVLEMVFHFMVLWSNTIRRWHGGYKRLMLLVKSQAHAAILNV